MSCVLSETIPILLKLAATFFGQGSARDEILAAKQDRRGSNRAVPQPSCRDSEGADLHTSLIEKCENRVIHWDNAGLVNNRTSFDASLKQHQAKPQPPNVRSNKFSSDTVARDHE